MLQYYYFYKIYIILNIICRSNNSITINILPVKYNNATIQIYNPTQTQIANPTIKSLTY